LGYGKNNYLLGMGQGWSRSASVLIRVVSDSMGLSWVGVWLLCVVLEGEF
jgi:hypothetical protein